MQKKVGRNDPCPCGSGKKYKKCCLNKSESNREIQGVVSQKAVKEPVDSLREKIKIFMEKGNFKSSFQSAISLYWNTTEEGLEPPGTMEDADISGIMEWFVHDYILPDYGKPLIAVFLDTSPKLTKNELQILKDWQVTNISVFQILNVELGTGLHVEDIFTDEKCFIHDVSISKVARRWELLIARKVWTIDEWQLSAVGRILLPQDKDEIYDFIMGKFRDYQKDNSDLKIDEFLHEKGYLLNNFVLTKTVKPREMPTIITSDNEEILICEAIYDVLDFRKTVNKLLKIPDYKMRTQTENEKGQPQHYGFDWLEKGKSAISSERAARKSGLIYQSFYTDGPGHESFRVLGNIEVFSDRLKLSVFGKKRFKAGKNLLNKHLKGSIKYRIDSLQSLDAKLKEENAKSEGVKEELDSDLKKRLLKDMYDNHYKNWLDSNIPALDHETPRQASKTKKGKKRLEDLLRVLEYTAEKQKRSGQNEYDISWIRKELGMYKKE
jgi:hypothetical protein